MIHKKARIYIAGHKGLVGSAILTKFQNEGYINIITRSHQELDLTRQDLVEKFFKTFTADKEISDAKKSTEVLNALSVNSRDEVDEMIEKAIEAGGREFREAQDHGCMEGLLKI